MCRKPWSAISWHALNESASALSAAFLVSSQPARKNASISSNVQIVVLMNASGIDSGFHLQNTWRGWFRAPVCRWHRRIFQDYGRCERGLQDFFGGFPPAIYCKVTVFCFSWPRLMLEMAVEGPSTICVFPCRVKM